MNNTMPLLNTRLLRAYGALSVQVIEVGIAVKIWARGWGLVGAGGGRLSSYAFLLMAIYFLQVAAPEPLPCLQEGGEQDRCFNDDGTAEALTRSLGAGSWQPGMSTPELLSGFFKFYAGDFDWGREVVSVRHGTRQDAGCFAQLRARPDGASLHIEDPFELHRDLADVV